ncbi:MAG: trypsin-like peptidase domain-containing protein [Planctomycetaceae bacterium]
MAGNRKNNGCRLTIFFGLLLVASAQALSDEQRSLTTLQPVVDQASAAVVRISVANQLSSGVVISDDGLILTVAHGFAYPDRTTTVHVPGSSADTSLSVKAEIVLKDSETDVVVLKIPRPEHGLTVMPIGPPVARHQQLIALGYPARTTSLPAAVPRFGTVVAGDDRLIRSTCRLTAGDSGGPVVDTAGRLVGLNQRIGTAHDANLHLTVATCRKALTKLPKPIPLPESPSVEPPVLGPPGPLPGMLGSLVRLTDVGGIQHEPSVKILGTLIAEDVVATKLSELRGRRQVVCRTANREAIEADLVWYDQTDDLAILRLKSKTTVEFTRPEATDVRPQAGDLVMSTAGPTLGMIGRSRFDEPAARAQLGCTIDAADGSLVVTQVFPKSAAADAGLQVHDVLKLLGDRPLAALNDVAQALRNTQPGDILAITFERSGHQLHASGQLTHSADTLLERSEFLDGHAGTLSHRRSGFRDVIQHDLPVNPAECGSPLFSSDGTLIGINIACRSREAVLAIPIERVLKLAQLLPHSAGEPGK